MDSTRTIILEFVDTHGASHIRELHIKHDYCCGFKKPASDLAAPERRSLAGSRQGDG